MLKKVIKFFQLSSLERNLFLKAFVLTIWIRIFTAILPFKSYTSYLGTPQKESAFETGKENKLIIPLIYRAMLRSIKYLPFNKKCFVEAIVVKKMLEKFNIESTIYFGVARNDNKNLIAHAWLRCGSSIITGKNGMENFVPVEWFT